MPPTRKSDALKDFESQLKEYTTEVTKLSPILGNEKVYATAAVKHRGKAGADSMILAPLYSGLAKSDRSDLLAAAAAIVRHVELSDADAVDAPDTEPEEAPETEAE